MIWERPGYDPFPHPRPRLRQRVYKSRALLEFACRKLLMKRDNVTMLENSRVTQILASEAGAVSGVRYEDAEWS